jgi:hypothetical protein
LSSAGLAASSAKFDKPPEPVLAVLHVIPVSHLSGGFVPDRNPLAGIAGVSKKLGREELFLMPVVPVP